MLKKCSTCVQLVRVSSFRNDLLQNPYFKLERYEGKNEAMSFRMKKSNHRTTDAWRKSILDGSYKLDFDQDFHGKSLVSTYLVIYEDNKLEKNEKCCIVLDANAPLGTIHMFCKLFL